MTPGSHSSPRSSRGKKTAKSLTPWQARLAFLSLVIKRITEVWEIVRDRWDMILSRVVKLKTIQGYIFRECIPPFLVGAAFFTTVMALQKVAELVQLTIEKATPFSVTLELFIYMLPFTAAITIPMGVLFGILLTFGRLSSTSEIIAMRANRISLLSIFAPAALFGLLSTLLMFWFINYVMPESNFRYKTLYKAVIYSNPGILLADRVFTDLPNTDKKISTLDVTDDGKLMHSVFIYEKDVKSGKVKIIYAQRGEWLNNSLNSPLITLQLFKGRSLELGNEDFEDIQNLEFEQIDMNIQNQVRSSGIEEKGLRELDVFKVGKLINDRKKIKQKVQSDLYIEFHKKFSIPIACMIFVILGMPLGVSFHRSGRGVSFGSAIIIIFAYYAFLTLGETLGNRGVIPAQLSMWLPNLILLIAGLIVFVWKMRE